MRTDGIAAVAQPLVGARTRYALNAERLLFDSVAIIAAVSLALYGRFALGLFEIKESSQLTQRAHVVACVVWLVGLLCSLAVNRLYDEDTLFPGGGESARVIRSVVGTGALLAAFVFLTQSFYVSRSWFGLTVVLSTAFLVAERQVFRAALKRSRAAGRGRRPALLVSKSGDAWREWRSEEIHEFDVRAKLDNVAFERFAMSDGSREGSDLGDAAVVLRARDFSSDEFWRVLLIAGQRGWSVFVHSPVRAVGRDRLTVRELGGHTIVKVAPPTLGGVRAAQKRAVDIAVSASLLIILLPVLALLALGVLTSSGRPAFYLQERVGLGGRRFRMLKLRTMVPNAESASGPTWASKNDDRRTPIGRLLRRWSLDELPQLWNVLCGDMSLVGPRPERPEFVEGFSESVGWYQFRHRIRPGITGWAQAQGLRGNTPIDPRVSSDNWYIENWSVGLDLKILLQTVLEVFRGKNAY